VIAGAIARKAIPFGALKQSLKTIWQEDLSGFLTRDYRRFAAPAHGQGEDPGPQVLREFEDGLVGAAGKTPAEVEEGIKRLLGPLSAAEQEAVRDLAAGIVARVEATVPALGRDACFAAGTPLLTPMGEKWVEDFKPGDLVLSRSEH